MKWYPRPAYNKSVLHLQRCLGKKNSSGCLHPKGQNSSPNWPAIDRRSINQRHENTDYDRTYPLRSRCYLQLPTSSSDSSGIFYLIFLIYAYCHGKACQVSAYDGSLMVVKARLKDNKLPLVGNGLIVTTPALSNGEYKTMNWFNIYPCLNLHLGARR
ncbi:hypothetical protein RRG08_018467 [Elysia crispata]|uniref:Uncharacterized protein n=1 Tax=Elysia crispata TaxID=231223 RepID=A0AAE0YTP0_9GAST|nr:hypothetical protein RRG08_018467 [Elysia crispata]